MRDGGRWVSAAQSHLRGKHRVPQLFTLHLFCCLSVCPQHQHPSRGAILKNCLFTRLDQICKTSHSWKLQDIQRYIIHGCAKIKHYIGATGFLSYLLQHICVTREQLENSTSYTVWCQSVVFLQGYIWTGLLYLNNINLSIRILIQKSIKALCL